MNKKILFSYIVFGVILVGLGAIVFWNVQQAPKASQTKNTTVVRSPAEGTQASFDQPKKSAHYESNTPQHGAVLAGVPINVVIDFNFDLSEGSRISIINSGKEYGTTDTSIDENMLTMRRSVDLNSPEGLYTVIYNACWPDGSCHDGNFQFVVDRTKADTLTDMRGQREIFVSLADITLKPQNVRILKGTKVTWRNDDTVVHYVNTDSHPAHTYFLTQNSKALQKGDAYSVQFDTPGIYTYHCSAHANSMVGTILVE
ncbi:MAG: copper resistance protein CopC [Candidatus Levybacteria bacterium]|nr:copper resistance protein CopC [Candidatus Levybacteria bacterium]